MRFVETSMGRGSGSRRAYLCQLARGVSYIVWYSPFRGWSANRKETTPGGGYRLTAAGLKTSKSEAVQWCSEDYSRFALDRARIDGILAQEGE
jgi:hypothetical protein